MKQGPAPVPRKVWTYWRQGLAGAPLVIRKCVESWVRRNPGWEVVVLDAGNISEHAGRILPEQIAANLSPIHFCDVLRLAVLSRHGGVWADATVFCVSPLDEWIDDCVGAGFFAFRNPGRDRMLASWFVASSAGCHLTRELYHRFRSYWIDSDFRPLQPAQKRLVLFLSKVFNRSTITTRCWFHPWVRSRLKLYPYYVFHYLFERVVGTDADCADIWNRCPVRSADAPHFLDQAGLLSAVTPDLKERAALLNAPVFKLTWKYDEHRYGPGTLLYELLEDKSDGREGVFASTRGSTHAPRADACAR